MKTCYEELGLSPIINASGRMSKLGVSIMQDEVKEVLGNAAQNYVSIDDLFEVAGKEIARIIRCEDVCICNSASSAITLAIASLICKDDLTKIKHFHQTIQENVQNEVIMLKGHNINYGAPIDEMIYLGGGKPIEVGYANESDARDLEGAISNQTLAILYVKSHHCVQKNMVTIDEVIQLARSKQIPCIIDASAEEDLSCYIEKGADIVCYSGAKAICGPTSGFASCRTQAYAHHMRLQYKGIGRAMKIGKENIMGLVKALSLYQRHGGSIANVSIDDLLLFMKDLNEIDGIDASILQDEAGRNIYRCNIHVQPLYGMHAKELIRHLETFQPAIYTRNYQANLGYIAIDPRGLKNKEDLHVILQAFKEIRKGNDT